MPQGKPAEGAMDHSQMNHGEMGQAEAASSSMVPPPPEAGSGPARAAVAIWGEEAMNEARRELVRETDGGMRFWFQGDRLEYRAREGKDGYLWDIQGYYGGDIDKFWFKSEGEGTRSRRSGAAPLRPSSISRRVFARTSPVRSARTRLSVYRASCRTVSRSMLRPSCPPRAM